MKIKLKNCIETEIISFAFLLVFALIPTIMRDTLPHDMIENLYWGKEWQLGYDKHPPLFSWISYAFYKICFSVPESMYFLTQINLGVGLFFIHKIALHIFKEKKTANVSILFTLCCLAFSFGNDKFNANTILISLLPAIYYFCLKFIELQAFKYTILIGLLSGMAFLGKYFAGIFLAIIGGFFLYFLCNKNNKERTNIILYLLAGIFVFLLVITPNIIWLVQNDFITLQYAATKAATGLNKSYFFCWNFLLMILLFYGTSIFVFKVSKCRFSNFNIHQFSIDEKFVICVSVFPCLFLFLVSLATGMRIGSLWCVNMIPLFGVILVLFANKQSLDFRKIAKNTVYFSLLCASAMVVRFAYAKFFIPIEKSTSSLDMRKIAKNIEKNISDFDIKYIDCDKKTDALHIYLKSNPSLYLLDNKKQIWIKETPNKQNIIVTRFVNDCKQIQENENFKIIGKIKINESCSVLYGVRNEK